ncbi:uncharacterized protein [Zea mays]|uniref:Biogenesis of lysosome-related organelles complex 1 subunit 7 n=1 Tax=Zea mays TaxID=4577 RepID=A0A804NN88_MAIZE|nr:uncharacterized protein LOC100277481 isoform X1 [Zea mays]XP_008677019.2 uncharacterized protein LOC100277481 isoform X1 [Zea mays]|eukprot:XP_008677018.2 uncharacterized protein LOC100277481 isoform X1 [Zea mays]
MDGADIPSHSAADGDRPPENADDGGVEDERAAAPPPERCGALASAIAGVLAGALREHEERAAATARSQDEVAAAIDRLNGELDRLLENAPTMVIMHHSARISSIRKRISAMNMLLKSIQRRIDSMDRIISTDHSSPVQKAGNEVGTSYGFQYHEVSGGEVLAEFWWCPINCAPFLFW